MATAACCAALLAGPVAAAPTAAAADREHGTAVLGCTGWTVAPPLNPGSADKFLSVAVLPSGDAWAVGSYDPLNGDPTEALAEHWDGSQWTGGGVTRGTFTGVAAISSTNVWVVGYTFSTGFRPLILHWDGTNWHYVATPRHTGILYGVAAISAANIWAVGSNVILHWNGAGWKKAAAPAGPLYAVAASSRTHVWAVGEVDHNRVRKTLVLRWNGTTWRRVASPNPAGTSGTSLNILDSVTAISRDNVWAVGYDGSSAPVRNTLIEHWNGTMWKQVASPNPGGPKGSVLAGVAATSASNVWAVGDYAGATRGLTLIARWNGARWKQVPSPNPTLNFTTNLFLDAVAATSAVNIWTVGSYSFDRVLAIHRC